LGLNVKVRFSGVARVSYLGNLLADFDLKSDEWHDEDELQANKGNWRQDDGCDDHRNPRTSPRKKRDSPGIDGDLHGLTIPRRPP